MKVKTVLILLTVAISGVLLAPAPKGGALIGGAIDATKAVVGKGVKVLGAATLATVGSTALKLIGSLGKAALIGAGALGVGLIGAKVIKLKIKGAKALFAQHSGGGSGSWSSSSSSSSDSSIPSLSSSSENTVSASASVNANLFKRK